MSIGIAVPQGGEVVKTAARVSAQEYRSCVQPTPVPSNGRAASIHRKIDAGQEGAFARVVVAVDQACLLGIHDATPHIFFDGQVQWTDGHGVRERLHMRSRLALPSACWAMSGFTLAHSGCFCPIRNKAF